MSELYNDAPINGQEYNSFYIYVVIIYQWLNNTI